MFALSSWEKRVGQHLEEESVADKHLVLLGFSQSSSSIEIVWMSVNCAAFSLLPVYSCISSLILLQCHSQNDKTHGVSFSDHTTVKFMG